MLSNDEISTSEDKLILVQQQLFIYRWISKLTFYIEKVDFFFRKTTHNIHEQCQRKRGTSHNLKHFQFNNEITYQLFSLQFPLV